MINKSCPFLVFGGGKVVGQQVPGLSSNSMMIAYYPPLEFAKKIAIPGGIDPADIHLSLAVFHPNANAPINQDLLDTTLKAFASAFHPLAGRISGVGRFTNADQDVDVVYASADVHHLHKQHDHLLKMLLGQGFPVNMQHSYDPHFSLKYIPVGSPMPEQTIANLSFTISSLCLVQGDKRTEYQFTGMPHSLEAEEECMNLDDLPPDLFEYLTKDQRDNIDDADFAWPDAPGGPKYPVHDQDHLDAAAKLIGRAPEGVQDKIKKNAIRIAKRKGLSLPDSWKEDDTTEANWTTAARKAYFKEHPENFAGPDMSFPIRDTSDVGDAWGLAGHADNPDAVRSKIISIAKRLGLTDGLPDTAKDFGKKKEAVQEDKFQPKPRIAQLKVRFLSDNAISRNGRQYPTETVHNLVNSGQSQIQAGDILNAYICHSVADDDNPLVVAGKASQIWHENGGAYGLFDIPDTSTGRDMVSLLLGGYIPPSMSLRASNAEMKVEKGKGVPQVVGDNIRLLGIDFTARPGIEDAKVQGITLENTPTQEIFQDSFFIEQMNLVEEDTPSSPTVVVHINLDGKTIGKYLQKEAMMEQTPQISEANVEELHPNQILQPTVSGNSQSVSDDPAGSEYTKKYPQLKAGPPAGLTDIGALADGPPAGLTDISALSGGPPKGLSSETVKNMHDHAASALGMKCAPGGMQEAGRALSKTNADHLVSIHDQAAKHLNMECMGSYQQMQNPNATPGNDDDTSSQQKKQGPDDDKMESKQEKKAMSVEEALALLKQNNYEVVPPKTEAEKVREALEAKLEEQRKQFEEMQAKFLEEQQKKMEEIQKAFAQSQPATQRKSLVESATNEQIPPQTPRARRSFVQEQLMKADWEKLADRSCPLPEGVTPEAILKHFGQMMIMSYNDKYGTGSIQPVHS